MCSNCPFQYTNILPISPFRNLDRFGGLWFPASLCKIRTRLKRTFRAVDSADHWYLYTLNLNFDRFDRPWIPAYPFKHSDRFDRPWDRSRGSDPHIPFFKTRTDSAVHGSLHPTLKIWTKSAVRRSVHTLVKIWTDSTVHGSLQSPLKIRTKSAVRGSPHALLKLGLIQTFMGPCIPL